MCVYLKEHSRVYVLRCFNRSVLVLLSDFTRKIRLVQRRELIYFFPNYYLLSINILLIQYCHDVNSNVVIQTFSVFKAFFFFFFFLIAYFIYRTCISRDFFFLGWHKRVHILRVLVHRRPFQLQIIRVFLPLVSRPFVVVRVV